MTLKLQPLLIGGRCLEEVSLKRCKPKMEVVVGCRSLLWVKSYNSGRMLMLYCAQVLLNYIRPEIIPYLQLLTILQHIILFELSIKIE